MWAEIHADGASRTVTAETEWARFGGSQRPWLSESMSGQRVLVENSHLQLLSVADSCRHCCSTHSSMYLPVAGAVVPARCGISSRSIALRNIARAGYHPCQAALRKGRSGALVLKCIVEQALRSAVASPNGLLVSILLDDADVLGDLSKRARPSQIQLKPVVSLFFCARYCPHRHVAWSAALSLSFAQALAGEVH